MAYSQAGLGLKNRGVLSDSTKPFDKPQDGKISFGLPHSNGEKSWKSFHEEEFHQKDVAGHLVELKLHWVDIRMWIASDKYANRTDGGVYKRHDLQQNFNMERAKRCLYCFNEIVAVKCDWNIQNKSRNYSTNTIMLRWP